MRELILFAFISVSVFSIAFSLEGNTNQCSSCFVTETPHFQKEIHASILMAPWEPASLIGQNLQLATDVNDDQSFL